jgi:hypothetical protein
MPQGRNAAAKSRTRPAALLDVAGASAGGPGAHKGRPYELIIICTGRLRVSARDGC